MKVNYCEKCGHVIPPIILDTGQYLSSPYIELCHCDDSELGEKNE